MSVGRPKAGRWDRKVEGAGGGMSASRVLRAGELQQEEYRRIYIGKKKRVMARARGRLGEDRRILAGHTLRYAATLREARQQ